MPGPRNWRFTLSNRHGSALSGIVVCWPLATHDTFDPSIVHQPCNSAARNVKPFPPHLMPDFAHTVDAEVLLKDPLNLRLQLGVTRRSI